jgi:hypothetical protein
MTQWLSVFLTLPQACLRKTHGGAGKREQGRLASQLNWYDQRWREADAHTAGEAVALSASLLRPGEQPPSRQPEHSDPKAKQRELIAKIDRATALASQGYLSRACAVLVSGKILPINDRLLSVLRDLHPAAAPNHIPQPPPNKPFIAVDSKSLATVIRRQVATGAAPGCSGLTGEHLLPLLDDEECLDGLTVLVQDISNNALGPHARQLLLQARLLAFEKPRAPNQPAPADAKPRPIAIGEVLFRASAAYCVKLSRSALNTVFAPLQLGAGAPGGAERAFHTIQAALEASGPDGCALIFDQENAFNTRDRATILSRLYAEPRLSMLWGICHFAYGGAATSLVIRKGDEIFARIPSANGTRQGCPLASILFCLSVHDEYRAAVLDTNTTTRAICDDLTSVGQPRDCLKVFDSLSTSSLNANVPKCKLLWPHETDPPTWLVTACEQRELTLARGANAAFSQKVLGAILGLNPQAVTEHAHAVVRKHIPLFEAVAHDRMRSQVACLLLRYCIQPLLCYITRTAKPSLVAAPLAEFDALLLTTFYRLVTKHGSPAHAEPLPTLPDELATLMSSPAPDPTLFSAVLKQVPKPIRQGGLGLRLASRVSTPAYWSGLSLAASDIEPFTSHNPQPGYHSFVDARDAAHKQLVLSGVCKQPPDANPLEGPKEMGPLIPHEPSSMADFYAEVFPHTKFKLQRLITHAIEDIAHAADFANAGQREKAVTLSLTGYAAGAWICAIPATDPLRLTDFQWATACLLRLGANLRCGSTCTKCGARVHPCTAVDHFLASCRNTPLYGPRHTLLARLTESQCVRAGVPSLYEEPPDTGVRLKPDGTQFFAHGKTLTDTTVRHPTAASYVALSAKRRNHTITIASASKHAKYDELAFAQQARFFPLVLETYGNMGSEYSAFLASVADAAADSKLLYPKQHFKSSSKTRLVREVAVTLQRGNAIAIKQGLMNTRYDSL